MGSNHIDFDKIFKGFEDLKVVIIGDIMVDAYLWGTADRISPEAPVPIIDISERENRLGGAANVALNIKSLGAKPIICSVIGEDDKGDILTDLMIKRELSTEGIHQSKTRTTTSKTRIISGGQQMLRVDEEIKEDLDTESEEILIEKIKEIIGLQKIDVIIFEDYNKGVLTENVIRSIIDLANEKNIPTTVDPKKSNFFSYKGATLFKPNVKELKEGLKIDFDKSDIDQLEKVVDQLKLAINNEISLITLSEHGIFVKSKEGTSHIPAHIRKISDVSGAGDTVISVASLCLASGLPHEIMATVANLSGGLVCEKVGVVPTDKEQLLKETKALFSN